MSPFINFIPPQNFLQWHKMTPNRCPYPLSHHNVATTKDSNKLCCSIAADALWQEKADTPGRHSSHIFPGHEGPRPACPRNSCTKSGPSCTGSSCPAFPTSRDVPLANLGASPEAGKVGTPFFQRHPGDCWECNCGSRECMFCPVKHISCARTYPNTGNPLHLVMSISSLRDTEEQVPKRW